ncbi:MAG: DUF2927 domain-containing protein [Hyphomicrobiales bacterium]|nr:DUF2927 domain-containing protein [Hyphomicrobiales bacterium]
MQFYRRIGTLSCLIAAVAISISLSGFAVQAGGRDYADRQLIDGFERTVFGLEYGGSGGAAAYVKKYRKPVRIFIDNRSRLDRRRAIVGFVNSLRSLIDGLDIAVVRNAVHANFRVYVVDRDQYPEIVSREVFGDRGAHAPGKCMVRVLSTRSGIKSSAAVIVSDEGDRLFKRCMIEEVLQGLGPLNDDARLSDSVFNDSSKKVAFTRHDRYILNMLYHQQVRAGMSQSEVGKVLPAVLKDVRETIH